MSLPDENGGSSASAGNATVISYCSYEQFIEEIFQPVNQVSCMVGHSPCLAIPGRQHHQSASVCLNQSRDSLLSTSSASRARSSQPEWSFYQLESPPPVYNTLPTDMGRKPPCYTSHHNPQSANMAPSRFVHAKTASEPIYFCSTDHRQPKQTLEPFAELRANLNQSRAQQHTFGNEQLAEYECSTTQHPDNCLQSEASSTNAQIGQVLSPYIRELEAERQGYRLKQQLVLKNKMFTESRLQQSPNFASNSMPNSGCFDHNNNNNNNNFHGRQWMEQRQESCDSGLDVNCANGGPNESLRPIHTRNFQPLQPISNPANSTTPTGSWDEQEDPFSMFNCALASLDDQFSDHLHW